MRFGRLPPRISLRHDFGWKIRTELSIRLVLKHDLIWKIKTVHEYFDYFSDLAPTLNERFITAERRGEALWLTRFNRYVAAIVLIGALGAVIYLLASGKATSEVLIFALGGVVASGGYLFFGRWLLPGTSDGTPTQPQAHLNWKHPSSRHVRSEH